MSLNIYDRRERALVAAADVALRPIGAIRRAFTAARQAVPQRILCLRLERIGDLLMTLPALAELGALAPDAAIDLVVGSWNVDIAGAIPGMDRIETVDAEWLARDRTGRPLAGLVRDARRWKSRAYDLALNFEPDIRSNLLLAASGARRLVGFTSGGGGPLLDLAIDYDTRAHTADNAVRLVRLAFGLADGPVRPGRLEVPDAARAEASRLVRPLGSGPVIALHANAGRLVKQWPEERFRAVAATLIAERGATIVLTGGPEDRALVASVKAGLLPERLIDVAGIDLVRLAAVLERVSLLVTCDTGPMHLAHAVGTPVVAVFGPSDPVRYAPRGPLDRIVRIDLPCAPCNRIRLPPARCTGHTPDCLSGIDAGRVLDAIDGVLGALVTERATGSSG